MYSCYTVMRLNFCEVIKDERLYGIDFAYGAHDP